ncbi:MAG: polysulfide reductase NrfD [SAR324 cluster bacterium]|jgi:molybdopterin-containing oxidoreductase family membrane subunit|nr:menaquinol oxidoreductase [Deltaproteobacteria bacterium]MDP6091013.1 polysulfide reductase NrfD [SAR324 cluster bacterium]MDP6245781.1 polysulfide reductase NrfD [SAR324 cluster bacterium]MDP6463538.1 polysulfide reductase NrfD [SAR324 cluster bacterium]MDP6638115.1 polysulfide reductase NrfD [SAR324 cluster bacterium]|tara:strand:+ start:667 stop:1815 length:1149 start_codon:yes stop_codon:yes gene_type:complete
MLENALKGGRSYWVLVSVLLVIFLLGVLAYSRQLSEGLTITGMSRDVSWGIYIAQFTFLVGVAASAVMVVLPYYLHDYKEFGKVVLLGEFLAVSSIIMCLMFILADMGKPERALYVILHPHPKSIMFWDMLSLTGYLVLNLFSAWGVLTAESKGVSPPIWVKPVIYLSIPWAVSIHTVTAFLYSGLPGRHLWLTAVLAPRFLASAFTAGPALLILLALLLRRTVGYDVGAKAIAKLAMIITYAALIHFFLVGMEFFTAFYSNIPSHIHGLEYLFFGLDGKSNLVPFLRISFILGLLSLLILLIPTLRHSTPWLAAASAGLFVSIWIDKGIGLILGGFVPSPMEEVVEYIPGFLEVCITLGIWAFGFLLLTVFYKMVVSVKRI